MRHLRTMLALAVVLAISCLAAPLALASPNTRGAPDAAFIKADTHDAVILAQLSGREEKSFKTGATPAPAVTITGPGSICSHHPKVTARPNGEGSVNALAVQPPFDAGDSRNYLNGKIDSIKNICGEKADHDHGRQRRPALT